MKRKLILIALMVAVLGCLFAFSVNAEEELAFDRVYTINGTEYPLWEQDEAGNYHPLMWYQDGDKLSSVWADNTDSTKAPYVTYSKWTSNTERQIQNFNITDENGNVFNGKQTVVIANLHKIYLKEGSDLEITYIHKDAFMGSTVLKAVYIPKAIKFMGWGSNNYLVPFENCKALEYAEFAPSTALEAINCNTFLNCTALKAISLPDSVKLINYSTFSNCTSLEAIYLPNSLEKFGANGWNRGAFFNCPKAYFVSEPFVIENMETDMPEKPEVYYFPENLTNHGEAIRGCTNVNNVLVYGDKITEHSSTMFTGTGKTGETKTVVFLGNMTSFSHTEGIGHTINFVFPNTTTPQEEFVAKTGARQYSSSALYFCKTGKKCALGYNSVSWTDDVTHFAEIIRSGVANEATCTENATMQFFCFCGADMGVNEVEGTALGHNHTIPVGAIYDSYLADGYTGNKCERCEDVSKEVLGALFTYHGYSCTEKAINGKYSVAQFFGVNNENVAKYEELTGKTVNFGIVATGNADGTAIKPLEKGDKVITQQFSDYPFEENSVNYFAVKVNGIASDYVETNFIFCAYVSVDGEVVYIDNNAQVTELAGISHSQLNSILN